MSRDRTRKLAVEALVEVERSSYSNIALDRKIREAKSGIDVPFATRLFYGTLERRNIIDRMIAYFSDRPLSSMDRVTLSIIRCGAYQLKYMDSVPRYAAISSSVDLCAAMGKKSAKGFVNAILRKIDAADPDSLTFSGEVDRICTVYNVSEQIARILMRDHPDTYEDILRGMYEPPEMTLAVNTVRIGEDEFIEKLSRAGIDAEKTEAEGLVRIESHGDVRTVPGFEEGLFFVQGLPSYVSVKSAGIRPGDRVVDLCAAPGGKSFTAVLSMNGDGEVMSCDPNESRLRVIRKSADRLGFGCVSTYENLGQIYDEKFSGRDVVVCDVPCSGIGTIARKPDLRYKDLSDVGELASLQYDILSTGARYVKNGGRLVYSTCTLNSVENEENVRRFLAENPGFVTVAPEGLPEQAVVRDSMVWFMPGKGGADGFFFAVMEKK